MKNKKSQGMSALDEPRRFIINTLLVILVIFFTFAITTSKFTGEELYRETYAKEIAFIHSQAMFSDFNVFYNFKNYLLAYRESEISFFDMDINYDFFLTDSMIKLYPSNSEKEVFYPYRASLNPTLLFNVPKEKFSTRGAFYIVKQGNQFNVNGELNYNLINCLNVHKINSIVYEPNPKPPKPDKLFVQAQGFEKQATNITLEEKHSLDENVVLILYPQGNLILDQALCIISNNIISNTDYKAVYLPYDKKEIKISIKNKKNQADILRYFTYTQND